MIEQPATVAQPERRLSPVKDLTTVKRAAVFFVRKPLNTLLCLKVNYLV